MVVRRDLARLVTLIVHTWRCMGSGVVSGSMGWSSPPPASSPPAGSCRGRLAHGPSCAAWERP
eukprot:345025-Pyramimonas_sp.AAC.1